MTPPEDRAPARAALLAAARAALDESGPEGVVLREVARRAGVSHAAPGYVFGDRTGMLTALAVEGFDGLAAVLEAVPEDAADRLAALGRAYVGFGLARPALLDLMFRPRLLHRDDPEYLRAAARAIAPLAGSSPADDRTAAVTAWALAHGLAVLVGHGALDPFAEDPAALAGDALEGYAATVGGGR